MKSFALFLPLLAAASAAAHGVVTQVTVDGKVYKGNLPGKTKNPSVIRLIDDPSPIKGATNPAVNCGAGAGPASLVANANPGSQLTFSWKGEDLSNWPHNIGPMLTYMASCGSVTCDKFDSTKAKWFKIGEDGKKPNSDNWVQEDVHNGAAAKATIPSDLAAGNYLVRHEIIALHLANTMGGAEFYEGCAQLKVGGNQSGEPSPSDLVSLPGAYKDNNPGIFDKNVFDNGAKYTFPGPAVASFITGGKATTAAGSDGNENNSDNTPSTGTTTTTTTEEDDDSTTAAPAPTSTSTSKKSGSCKAKGKKNMNAASPSVGSSATSTPGSLAVAPTTTPQAGGSYYPRQISRVMARHLAKAQSLQHPH